MSKKRKSVSDKLLDLINPTPVHFDPEADIHIETAAKVADYEDDEDNFSDDGALSVFRKRNAQLLEDVDKRYAGKKVSRKSLGSFADKAEDPTYSDDASEDYGSDRDISEDGSDQNLVEDSSDGHLSEDGSEGNLSENGFDGNLSEVNDLDKNDSDEMDSDDSENGEDLSGVVVEDSDLEEADESNDFVHLAAKDTGAEIDKGKAIQTQLNLWDGLLEARITMQKVLAVANKLPQPEERPAFVSEGGRKFTGVTKSTRKAVSSLLDKLIELREQRLQSFSETKDIANSKSEKTKTPGSDEEITSSEDGDKKEQKLAQKKEKEEEVKNKPRYKRKLEDYEAALASQHAEFAAYRNATIQRWNDKTRLSGGKASSRSFSAFEQSTLKQVEQIMSNMHRLVARTRVKRVAYRSLGKPAVTTDPTELAPEEIDPEIFDDGDFYHTQLRELIERKSGTAPLGRQWLALQSARAKMKRKIDTKATKGRRLRFTPHTKLLSFMAPVDELPFNEEARNDLFASLFGAKR